MKVEFRNKTMQKICEDASTAERKYGLKMAVKIQQRIDEIKAADSVEMMLKHRIGRCHQLHGDRNNQFAVDLVHPQRLIFEKKGSEIQIVRIIEITDYH